MAEILMEPSVDIKTTPEAAPSPPIAPEAAVPPTEAPADPKVEDKTAPGPTESVTSISTAPVADQLLDRPKKKSKPQGKLLEEVVHSTLELVESAPGTEGHPPKIRVRGEF